VRFGTVSINQVTIGLTIVREAVLLVSAGQLYKLRFIKLRTLVDLLLIVCTWDDHFKLLSISTPRHTWHSLMAISCPDKVQLCCIGDREQVHLSTAHLSTFTFICHSLVHSDNICKSSCRCSASCKVVIGL